MNESDTQTLVRLEAGRLGFPLWRNNVGAGVMQNGSFVRWGLANDSKAVNERMKSSDLVGLRPIIIQPHHVGSMIGQFVSREIKRSNWVWSGTPEELAQSRWMELVLSLGGDAAFATGEGSL